ncbi:MAG: hypothetical protein II179_02885 [Alphaproteobacteria bacterium]|nr:hypothetical protein [Alphaproteobacteria bacterium]
MNTIIRRALLGCSLVALCTGTAGAAGTYYTGNYRSPQQNYAKTSYAARQQQQQTSYTQDTMYTRTRTVAPNNNAYIGAPYQDYTRVVGTGNQQVSNQTRFVDNKNKVEKGFFFDLGLSHEFANWNFEMKSAGSKLHYDNIRWNVIEGDMKYVFGGDKTPLLIEAGAKYGMQFGDSTMIDDDITNGGYFITQWWSDQNENDQYDPGVDTYIGQQTGHSLSIGSSSSGNMLGLYAGFGLPDTFRIGVARVTPSIGYRYLKYKLETKDDYGLTVDTGYCASVNGGDEVQCDPIVILTTYHSGSGFDVDQQVMWESNKIYNADGTWTGYWVFPSGDNAVTTGGTYMFHLPSISHSYETTWMGPYLALDLDYDVNVYNKFNARFEFGLPMYTSTGDQPYRVDWQHPKSVEDKGGFGDAWHIGLGANYMTALTESVFFSLGFTFDYYTMSGGEANTYLNSGYYMGIYNDLFDYYSGITETQGMTMAQIQQYMLDNDATVQNIAQIEAECPGWVCKVDNEIESIYKSMGIHVGIQAKF